LDAAALSQWWDALSRAIAWKAVEGDVSLAPRERKWVVRLHLSTRNTSLALWPLVEIHDRAQGEFIRLARQ